MRKDLTPEDGETRLPSFNLTLINPSTRCSVYLKAALDFEKASSYVLQLIGEVPQTYEVGFIPLLQNAWTDGAVDSRNVATIEFVVAVTNIADTPPVFISAPPITRMPQTSLPGDFVLSVVAKDGDAGPGRPIR